MDIQKNVCEAAAFIREKFPSLPRLAIILGSGLGGFASRLTEPQAISTEAIPHYPRSTVAGHAGQWVFGYLQKHALLAVRGRVHFYEGYPMEVVSFPVRILAELGVTHLIVTNAAGSLNPLFRPGDLMLIDDHINFFFRNPLISSAPVPAEKRFVDMSAPYHPALMAIAEECALELGIPLERGILVGSSGPTYETHAEVRMMQRLGADAATMSTVPEVLTANQLGMKVLGISCITNLATGLSAHKLDHTEVTEVAARVAEKFQRLMEAIAVQISEREFGDHQNA